MFLLCAAIELRAQQILKIDTLTKDSIEYRIQSGTQRLTLGVNSSRILSLEDKEISRVLVNNSSLVNAIAISSNQIQLSALKPGITQLNP